MRSNLIECDGNDPLQDKATQALAGNRAQDTDELYVSVRRLDARKDRIGSERSISAKSNEIPLVWVVDSMPMSLLLPTENVRRKLSP
jgi:hypothetical protein